MPAALAVRDPDKVKSGPAPRHCVKVAVISDVHANLEALQAVLSDAGGSDLYCLGDLVDYGANPNEVIAILEESRAVAIMGNHDRAALTGDTSMLNPKAAMSSIWTKSRLTRESVGYLESLRDEMRVRLGDVDAYFTHGSPDDHLWEYVDPRTHSDLFGHFLKKTGVRLMGLGHTHLPYVWRGEEGVVFNPGSVGQPRDGDRRASYALVSAEGGVDVEVRRVEYDVEEAARKIREAGLPASHADRLSTGG